MGSPTRSSILDLRSMVDPRYSPLDRSSILDPQSILDLRPSIGRAINFGPGADAPESDPLLGG
eukprot:1912851-Pyramimonas_sp.AAC.1